MTETWAQRQRREAVDILSRALPDVQARLDEAAPLLPEADLANRNTLLSRARSALRGNATFLAINSPTNAQNAAQIKALTRQVNALIKIALNDLNTTEGT